MFGATSEHNTHALSVSEVTYGRKTRIIQTDFTEGDGIYPAIADRLQGLEIGILGMNLF